jgi:Mrp family chromosome partitioning ATPase
MSRLFDAVSSARALAPRQPGPSAIANSPVELPLLRLWQAVEARLGERAPRIIQIAACVEGEADSSVAMGLARLAGRSGGRGVLLLDGVRTSASGDGEVAFGPLPGRSGDARQLRPDLLRRLWSTLGEQADLIVLDSPPVLGSPLTLALAPTVDGVVLLVEAERTRDAVAMAARDALIAAGAEVLGVVLHGRRLHVPKAVYDRL